MFLGRQQASSSQNDFSNINNILDVNIPTPNISEANNTVKSEPIEDLIIDEDAFQHDSTDLQSKPPDIPLTIEANSFSQATTNYSESLNSFQISNNLSEYTTNSMKDCDPASVENNSCMFCFTCNRKYSTASNLRAHVLNVHMEPSQISWFQCSVCGQKCKTKHYLINHEMRKHGISQKSKARVPYLDLSNDDTL